MRLQRLLSGIFVAALLVTVLPGCRSSRKASERVPAGIPKVSVAVDRPDPLIETIHEFFAGRGYVESTSDHAYEFVFDRPYKDRLDRALRVRVRIYHEGGRWSMIGKPFIVESWHGDLETERVVPNAYEQIQMFLEAIQLGAEARP